jgi:undecaprenyl-diphosphatase
VIGTVVNHLMSMPAWLALLAVFAVPALEASAFLGFLFPGETVLVVGGLLAAHGTVPLWAVLAVGIGGAIIGDSIGYAVGRRYGARAVRGVAGRWVSDVRLDRARRYVSDRGGRAVFFGRFTAALRVLVPGLAGMSGMRYRDFLGYNIAGGAMWAAVAVLLGYFGGNSWQHLTHVASDAGAVALGLLVLGAVGSHLWRSRRSRRAPRPDAAPDESQRLTSREGIGADCD